MGRVKIPYYVVCKSRGYWLASARMQTMGFPSSVRCGPDGPDAWRLANEWNARWQDARLGRNTAELRAWPRGSLGEAFDRYRRTKTWEAKKPRTREDWERGWRYIKEYFGDVAPHTVTLEHIDAWYHSVKGSAGVSEAYRAMKIWRALWQAAASMGYCNQSQDPSLGVRRETPRGRSATWTESEVAQLVEGALQTGYRGLACIIAVAYDSGLSPVDARSLTFAQSRTDGDRIWFEVSRAKTGREALGTLSTRTKSLVEAYLAELSVAFHPDAPIFRTQGHVPARKGGRLRHPVPYTKDTLCGNFRKLRRQIFGPGETRRLMDMRRTVTVEAVAGGADAGALSATTSQHAFRLKSAPARLYPGRKGSGRACR